MKRFAQLAADYGVETAWETPSALELFDQQNDPGEVINLAHHASHRERLVSMQAELGEFLPQTGDMLYSDWTRDRGHDYVAN